MGIVHDRLAEDCSDCPILKAIDNRLARNIYDGNDVLNLLSEIEIRIMKADDKNEICKIIDSFKNGVKEGWLKALE